MAKIISIRTAMIWPKNQISGTILIEANSFIHDVIQGIIRCNVNYYLREESRLITSDPWILPEEKKAILLEACLNDFGSLDNLLSQMLLEQYQENSVFGILGNEWQISNDSLAGKDNNTNDNQPIIQQI